MGLLDLPAPLFQAVDTALAIALPSALRLVVWGVIAGLATMLLYRAISPQGRITEAKQGLVEARLALDAHEGSFSEARSLMADMMGHSLRQIGLVLGPALVSGLPALCLIVWIDGAYGYDYPAPGYEPTVQVAPAGYSARWPEGDEAIVVTDDRGGTVERIALDAPVPVVHKRAWWNLLIANPAGYLADDLPVERIEIDLPSQRHLPFGPDWVRGWPLIFFLTLFMAALAIKWILRIQ